MNFFIKVILLQVLFTLYVISAFTQNNSEATFYHRGSTFGNIGATPLSTGNSGTGANIDVVYHRCNWTADPDDATKTLKGNVTTYFKTIANNVSSISFDFNNTSFNNDSLIVLYHGTACSFSFPLSGNLDVLIIALPVTLASAGILDSVTIKYEGIPPAENNNALGYQRDVDAASNNYIYTLSESYEDKDWWPCKADMKDKIDSIDINVTVPNIFWVAANGRMTDSAITGANRTFKFKHRYPIASYLVAIAIAKYKRYYLGNLSVGSKTIPFVVNLFPGKTTTSENSILNYMNNHKLVFAALNNLYGDYPYSNEKHGFYEFGFGGGMEHQTFSGIGTSSLQSNSVLAHELGHQWWGDKVTFATWNHLWLAEGFATYSEVLAAEFVPSLGVNAVNKMANNKSAARNYASNATYISSIANSNAVWGNSNTAAVYNRGCMVVSMLRSLMGDTKFFAGCKNYLSDTAIAFKSAVSNDLQHNMESQFGENMTGFFTEWVTKKGIPNYTVEWGNVGDKINIKLAQTITATGSASITASTFFPMPVVIKITDASGSVDTTVIIYHKAANQLMFSGDGVGALVNSNTISYNLSFTPATVTFDPENKTMANGTVTFSALLPIAKAEIVAKKLQNKNQLTATIIANDLIEKVELQKSIDAIHFATIGQMQKVSSSAAMQQYQLLDESNGTPKMYYRAMVNTTNKEIFSNIIVVENKTAESSIVLSPNPTKNFVNVYFANKNTATVTVKLTNTLGKILQTKTTTSSNVIFETNSFCNGVYLVNIFKGDKLIWAEKLVKQ